MLLSEAKNMQTETIDLVVKEKLNADESFLIFFDLSQLVIQEAKEAKEGLNFHDH